jgi:4-hydroxythreonine-4-phosphate dehydrogenase
MQPATPIKPTLAITMGDPLGIGPEIVVRALADRSLQQRARFVIFGMNEQLAYAADLLEIEPFWWRVQHDTEALESWRNHGLLVLDYDEYSLLGTPRRVPPGPTREGGQASYQFVEDAIAASKLPADDPRHVQAIVTAPISKEAWHLAGKRWPGHTELLARRYKAKRSAMMFVAPQLRVVLATIHLPLMDLRNILTIGKVFEPIDLGNQACLDMGLKRPRIAVCGLNPHASENGLFGDEEERLIAPAIELARAQGILAEGPFPADTIFNAAVAGRYDLVVAMYHDQGLIPVKLLAWDSAVNTTLGLPVVRTSPDHGTAFDIAGKGQASEQSLRAAIELALDMTSARLRREADARAK